MSISFSELGIQQSLEQSLKALHIAIPTEIQKKAIPEILNTTNDVVGIAQTGTGKTVAFGMPIIQLIDVNNTNIQAVILAPTRELGQQIFNNLISYTATLQKVKIVSVCGGTPIKPQIECLTKTTHIVVATPGRLVDLIKRGSINLKETRFLVLDEADEMVSNLKEGLDKIKVALPKKYRTFLFSATIPGAIKQLIQNYLSKNVTQISITLNVTANQEISHEYIVVAPIEKLSVLMHFLSSREGQQGIIFCKTKAAVNKLAKNLAIHKFSSGAIHGSLTQAIRDRIMGQFRNGYIDILIATDLVSRGIDVKEIAYVVNYHLPDTFEAYVHRTGRTARAGAKGFALTVIQQNELVELSDFETELSISFKKMKKTDAKSIEENNTLLWAKKIFKMKPNREISSNFKQKIHTVFHHLTKEELVDKLLAQYLHQQNNSIAIKPLKRK